MESPINFKPILGRVLIKREVKDKVGSIIIADPKRHAKCEGKIVALGETAGWSETYNDNLERTPVKILNVGDHVIFGRHAGTWLDSTYSMQGENDDGTLFLCQEGDILAIKEQV